MKFLKFVPKQNPGGDFLLALDIGTAFAKAGLLKLDRVKGRAELITLLKKKQKQGDMQAGAVRDISSVVNTCQELLNNVFAGKKQPRPEQIILGIPGRLVKGATTTLCWQREQPEQKIKQTELANVINKIQWRALAKIRRDLAWETGVNEIDVKLINAVISEIKIDGYRVNNPLGFKGREISLSIFNVYVPLVYLSALQEISLCLGFSSFCVEAEPYALAKSFYPFYNQENGIFVDMGGGVTDVALLVKGRVEAIESFSMGGGAFSNRIAKRLNINFEQAEAIKIKYSQGKLSATVKRKINVLIRKDVKVWRSGLKLILEEFSRRFILPENIFLCGGGARLPEIKRFLEKRNWLKNLAFAKQPCPRFILPKDLPYLSGTAKAKTIDQVMPLALASLAAENILCQNEVSQALARSVKIISK